MEYTLSSGDLIIINKTLYSGTFSQLLTKVGVTSKPKINEILVFKTNKSQNTFYVKRCIGLPGRTVKIKSGQVFIDNKIIPDLSSYRHLYQLWYSNYSLLENTLIKSRIDLLGNGYQRMPSFILISLNEVQMKVISLKPGVDSIKIFAVNKTGKDHYFDSLKSSEIIQDSRPFLIPSIGMDLKIDLSAFLQYKEILQKYEGVRIEQKRDLFFINGIKQDHYQFKKDYYYMMGDNRENSIDSRVFGPIPKDCIEGVVSMKI